MFAHHKIEKFITQKRAPKREFLDLELERIFQAESPSNPETITRLNFTEIINKTREGYLKYLPSLRNL